MSSETGGTADAAAAAEAPGPDPDRSWYLYRGTGTPRGDDVAWPEPPPWRRFAADDRAGDDLAGDDLAGDDLAGPDPEPWPRGSVGSRPDVEARARAYRPDRDVLDTVNAAIYLRRPLLVTGKPGTGKSTLAYAVALELGLGPVLHWPVTSRSTLADALYRYDAIGRLQDANLHRADPRAEIPDIGRFLRLGPLGTALLPRRRPRVLLVDELDKSDLDLPNDLLNVFEEGEFDIPELARVPADHQPVTVTTHDGSRAVVDQGRVRCHEFPVVVLTSNGEREFPSAFRRRCLSLTIAPPDKDRLRAIVAAQVGPDRLDDSEDLLATFVRSRDHHDLSTDQLLNLVFLAGTGQLPSAELRERLIGLLLRSIAEG